MIAVPTGLIEVKFDLRDFMKICRENPLLIKNGTKEGALHEDQIMFHCGWQH